MQDYNCTSSVDNGYGASDYGTCSTQIGVPNTGLFQSFYTGSWLVIVLPLASVIIITALSVIIAKRRKKRSTDASL